MPGSSKETLSSWKTGGWGWERAQEFSPRQGQGVCHLLPTLPPPSLSFPAALRACKVISIHLVRFYVSQLSVLHVWSSMVPSACATLQPKWTLLLPSTPCSWMTQDAGIIWVTNIHGKIALGVLFFTMMISFVYLTNTWTTLIEMAAIGP